MSRPLLVQKYKKFVHGIRAKEEIFEAKLIGVLQGKRIVLIHDLKEQCHQIYFSESQIL